MGEFNLFKKSTAILLTSLLTFSSAAAGAYAAGPVPTKSPVQENVKVKKVTPRVLENPVTERAANEKVRVIVELEGTPAIQYAQQKGLKYSELSESTKEQLEVEALAAQKNVVSQLSSKKLNLKVLKSFTTVVNGFSAEVEYGNIKFIEATEGVSKVYVTHEYQRPTEKPEMLYSKELVEAQRAWDEYGYKGEGMIVGVIDTGIDPEHRDMVLSAETQEELTKAEVDQIVNEQSLPGKYYTDKVPYGYNYMDDNDTILDLGSAASMHGMHVSGTVGANGDEENGGIKGVAPEAQILGLKVFGNDPEMPSTFSDIYVKAIDDAIKLGVDVINMSLGSTAGFVLPDDPEQKAVQRAVENGVLMSISAGNSAHFGNGFASANPYPSNPDIGVSGSPGVSFNSLQVASYENSYMDLDAVTFNVDGTDTKYPFLSASSVSPLDVETKQFDIVSVGLGYPEDFAGKDLTGKYALIQRGSQSPDRVIGFVDKTKNAQAAGAAGVIIYNNADGYVNMATDPAIQIPQLFMLKADGDAVKAALTAGQTVSLSFNGDKTKAANPSATKMSDFTSWGLTPNLDFKPEITAPGGQILSTFQNNTYGMMSGTSMAAPHVAGGSAIVLERVDSEFGLARNLDRVQMAKNILMNTAKPAIDKGLINGMFGFNIPYSPRRQGGGLMQLHAALSTPVVVTEATTNEAKVALRQINDNVVSYTLKAKNYSNAAVSYNVGVNVQTDLALFGELGYEASKLEAQPLENVGIKINGTATVDAEGTPIAVPALELAPGEEKTITVELDLTDALVVNRNASGYVPATSIFTNGYFVEGFVTLTDVADAHPQLSVPYVGFKGKWDQAPVLDAPMWDAKTFYGMTGMLDENYNFLGYDYATGDINPGTIAFSPNGDGVQDQAIPLVSFLRNAKKVEFNILDKDGNKIRTLRTENNVRKNYYDGGRSPEYSLNPARAWDGVASLKNVPEGDYQYEIRSVIDFPGAEWQSLKLPIKVDLTQPTVEANYDTATKTINVTKLEDTNGSGIAYWLPLVDGVPVVEDALTVADTNFTLEKLSASSYVDVAAVDNAGNITIINVQDAVDTTIPDVHVTSPDAFGTAGSREVQVRGYVVDNSGIHDLTIDGKAVDITYNPTSKQYEFSTVLTFDTDGVKKYDVKAVDGKDNEISFQRTLFVDSTAPIVNVSTVPNHVPNSTDKLVVDLNVEDNFDEIRVTVNGNEIFYNEFVEPYAMRGFKKTLTGIELPLQVGVNTFEFQVTDLAGHTTTKVVEVTRSADVPAPTTPPSTPPTTPTTPPVSGVPGTVVVDPATGGVTLNLDATKLAGLVDPAKADIAVDLSALFTQTKSVSTKVSADSLKTVAALKKNISINTGSETVNVPASVLTSIATAPVDNVSFSIQKSTAASGQNAVSEVLNLKIQLEKDGKQTEFSTFAEPVTVSVSVKGKTFADKRKVTALYLNEATNKWEYVGGKVSGENFVFDTRHFSKYVVVENNKTFADVKGSFAQDAVEVLASREVIQGVGADKFGPSSDLTRGQFAVLLARALNLPKAAYEGKFNDVPESATWAALEVEAAQRAGIINGLSADKFGLNEKITREQMAAMIVRAIEFQDKSLLADVKPAGEFKDSAKISGFAKDAVEIATALNIIKGNNDQTFAPKANTTRAQAAVVLYRLLDSLKELQ
jgi:lactocepin